MSGIFSKAIAKAHVAVTWLWNSIRSRRPEAGRPCNPQWSGQ